jgi:hypothetical protein
MSSLPCGIEAAISKELSMAAEISPFLEQYSSKDLPQSLLPHDYEILVRTTDGTVVLMGRQAADDACPDLEHAYPQSQMANDRQGAAWVVFPRDI